MSSRLETSLAEKFANKKILVLGFAREGQSTYKLLRRIFPELQIDVSDQQEVDRSLLDQKTIVEKYLENLSAYDVIFKTPGISIQEPTLQSFLQQGKSITSQMNEFLAVYREQTIGVTGTKGKSTTSSLIYHILQTAKVPSVLGGNIGTPVFDMVSEITPEMQIVLELSSYQLETVTVSPHIAVLLNIFPEHLNYHRTLDQYLDAKANITLFQTAHDIFVYNETFPVLAALARQTKAQTKAFSPAMTNQYFSDGMFGGDYLFENLSPVIRKNNVVPAAVVTEICCVKREDVIAALHSFETLPHRLEKVGTFKGVTFIDDTLATIPEATIEALNALPKVDILLLGGFDRGIDYAKIVEQVMLKKVPVVIFFKPSGERMYELMKLKYPSEQHPQVFFVDSMKEAVELAYEKAPQNGVVLLSPSSPSYGQFKNYEDKSAQYVEWIKKLAP
jgi:UDP-N-acetylmuramoylalanine--D-glutamate ligase